MDQLSFRDILPVVGSIVSRRRAGYVLHLSSGLHQAAITNSVWRIGVG